MPTNKEAYIRYRVIDKCLRNELYQYPTKEELRDKCIEVLGLNSLSLKTIEKDIYDMRYNEQLGFFAPIEYKKKGEIRGYYYTQKDYSISNVALNRDEITSLLSAANFLNQYNEVSYFANFSDTIDKIIDSLMLSNTQEITSMNQVQFDKIFYKKGGEYFNDLFLAIQLKKQVKIQYQRFQCTESKEHIIEPKVLKEFKGLWYVVTIRKIGEDDVTMTFALDRIIELEELGSFQGTDYFEEFTDYFNSCIGITKSKIGVINIRIKFSKIQSNYVKLMPFHHSQIMLQESVDYMEVGLSIIPNKEFFMKLLSYGDGVLDVQPKEVKEEYKAIIESMNKNMN